MKIAKLKTLIITIFLIGSVEIRVFAQEQPPVNPEASEKAKELLSYIYSISGTKTLSGQHSVPLDGSNRLFGVYRHTKHYPAIYGQDFGFSPEGTWDGINFRQRIIDEAIRRSKEGFIITLMWHAVNPVDEEPVSFEGSIQGELTDQEWNDLFIPGTTVHERWESQVDVIAWFLKQLKRADIPVLWRPYHEMNGPWFWWGDKKGENGYKKLWIMMYERLVEFHKLNNLIWVFNANEVKNGVGSYKEYYPGDEYVDILATDVYTEGFNQENYDELLALAKDKPIALGEVGMLPSEEILNSQPRWTWYMFWHEPHRLNEKKETSINTYKSDRVISFKELPWIDLDEITSHMPIK